MNIYEIFKDLKFRVDIFDPTRYVVVFVDKARKTYCFELCNSYCDLVHENFGSYNIFVAFRKSGKIKEIILLDKEEGAI